jgi:hypothetical protein
LNALWSHAYVAMSKLARTAGRRENAAFYLAWAQDHQKRFLEILWDERRGVLLDRLADGEPASEVTADQLWALALGPPLLPPERAVQVVASIERGLASTFGLRPTSSNDVIDSAWLGPWLTAQLRASGRSEASIRATRSRIEEVSEWLENDGLGGLPAAWSSDGVPDGSAGRSPLATAELLRFWVEDFEHASAPIEASSS